MKRIVDLYFQFGATSHKPSCQVVDVGSGEVLAFVTRDNWEEAEKAAIRETQKRLVVDRPPPHRTVEIEVPDPDPVELTEDMVEEKK